ncbi:MAG: HAMP domain-containing protein [Elusimicrobiales bacterium]|nr:HAMP domain-containing protein [Elusimicrobiales bacterium]NLH39388.1 HAMP domain-containing protein [Elusimicrobiota bacterium]
MFKVFKNKIIFTYLLFVVLLSSGFFILTYNIFKNEITENIKRELISTTQYTKDIIKSENIKDIKKLDDISKLVKDIFNLRVTFIDNNGEVLADSDVKPEDIKKLENHITRPEVKSALEGSPEFSVRSSPTLKNNMMYYAEAINIADKNLIVRTAVEFDYVKNSLNQLRNKILIYFSGVMLLALFIGIYLFITILKPFDRIIYASKEFANGIFSHRILIDFSGEVKKLAETLNSMAESIQRDMREIMNTNAHLKALIDNMKNGICLVDNKLKILSYNRAFLNIFSLTDDIYQRDINSVVLDSGIMHNLDISNSENRFISEEIKINERYYMVDFCPFNAGNKKNTIIFFYDIDEIKKLETVKREFISNISHDLKTPLTVIKTNIETLISNDMDKKTASEFLNVIEKHTERMISLVKDIINLNYLESENIKPEIKEINLKDFITRCYSYIKQLYDEKKIKFINEIPSDLKINADENIMENVFINLMDNAVKFNKEAGYVKCFVQNNQIIFENSGPKIPESEISRIFERFYKVDKSRGETKGTGLGLSIVKHGLMLHNASITASNFESGVRFIINNLH